jgi:hypothetical protein
VSDAFASRFLGDVSAEVERVAAEPATELPRLLRDVVRRTLLAIRPDGSWPESSLLQEGMRAYVDLIEAAFADQGVGLDELDPQDRRWFDACRESIQSDELFDDMLADLRASIRPPGVLP